MVRPLERGAVVAAAVLTPALIVDGAIVYGGLDAFCDHARRHPRVTAGGLIYLALHIYRPPWIPTWLRRLDPLSTAGRLLERR